MDSQLPESLPSGIPLCAVWTQILDLLKNRNFLWLWFGSSSFGGRQFC